MGVERILVYAGPALAAVETQAARDIRAFLHAIVGNVAVHAILDPRRPWRGWQW